MLVIEGRFPGLNDYIDAERASRYQGSKMKRRYTELVRDLAIVTHEPRHSGRAAVRITCWERDERRDADNVEATAKKFILDGLVAARVIVDDNRRWLAECRCDVRTDRSHPRIEVVVVDAEGRR